VGAERYTSEVDASAPNSAHAFALQLVGHGQRVLEFGCAAGHVTEVLVERGCSVVGLELDPGAAELASRSATEVHVVDLDTEDFAGELSGQLFDVALFGDVLEHLRDPLRVLRASRRLLVPGSGFIVASVPNIAHVDVRLSLLHGQFDYQPWGLLDESHLRFFTRDSLDRLLDQAGYIPTDLHRVVKPAFESEVAVDRMLIDEAMLSAVLRDPEAETYQFVVRAVPLDAASAVADLAPRVLRLEDELHQAKRDRQREAESLERRIEVAEQRAATAEAHAHDVESGTRDRLRDAEAAAAAHADLAAHSSAELEAMRRTRLFRWTSTLRSLYSFATRQEARRRAKLVLERGIQS
jgi:2-polyprenyl-3-methyl-5-hydroxy-6-metoxy-1,4-benzoquinol methylase